MNFIYTDPIKFSILYIYHKKRNKSTETEVFMKKIISSLVCFTLCAGTLPYVPVSAENTGVYTFGNEYLMVKEFDTSSLAETDIGSTGFRVKTQSSNYNNVVIRSKSSTNAGYYPYGSGLEDNGYYLFLGSGGNSSVSDTLTLPTKAESGQYLKITYAKPYSTNDGSHNRNEVNNDITVTVGSETIDLQNHCDFDTWYTTTVYLDEDISTIDINLGKWSAIAISSIEISDSGDTLSLSSEDNTVSEFITDEDRTVQYTATVYKSATTLMNDSKFVFTGSSLGSEGIDYSVSGCAGPSIDENGLLTIPSTSEPGIAVIEASYNGTVKSMELELKAVGDADQLKLVGDELVNAGSTAEFTAYPMAEETVIPERPVIWTIEGDDHGCVIDNGVLTVPQDAQPGNITLKAELEVTGSQTSSGISDTMTITIKNESSTSPYSINGLFLTNGASTVSSAEGIEGLSVDADSTESGYKAVIKALDSHGITIESTQVDVSFSETGVQELEANMSFKKADSIKAYIINSNNEIVTELYKANGGLYKNIPLVADWITGEKSGLGMGKGIISPVGAPYGVDPDLVDVSELNVNYTYDDNYQGPDTDNALWYKTGAFLASASGANNSIYARDGADWEQKALPIGNGYMGGMLFGLPDKDQIQFNEETFWAAGYKGFDEPVTSSTINTNMSEGINGYMSVGNIFVDFNMPDNATVNNYYRDLNLDESVAHVRYEYNGVKYNREYFASYPAEVLVLRYTADTPGSLSFDVSPVSMHPGSAVVDNGEITITGRLKDSEPYSSGGNAAWACESDLEYCTKIKVIADDGTVTDGYNSVSVNGSSAVTIIVAAATDYDPNQFVLNDDGSVDMSATPYKNEKGILAAIEKAESRINNASGKTYDELKAEHIADYKSQFDTVEFSLTDDDEICSTPTDELQASYSSVVNVAAQSDGTTKVTYDKNSYSSLDKHLEELHYNYARYLMISSSRSTTLPANLQGKWCQSTAEIWGSCYCININMEMNYWFAGSAGLLDSGKSLIGWFNSQIPAGRITAKNMYNVTPKSYTFENGVMTFTDSDEDKDDVFIMHTKQAAMGTTDMTGSLSIQSPGNTAWLMYNLWDLYLTSQDKGLLNNDIYPIMRKVANFYTQYLYTNMRVTTNDTEKYPDGYYYTTWSGRSPEHGPTHTGIKYDLQLVAGMYDYVIEAAEILGLDADKVSAWKEIRDHLELPVELGDDGQVKEWAEETTYNTDANGTALGDPVHRHISGLVALYPGNLINRNTPELLEGAKVVLDKRGDDATGWSCSNKFLLRARTLDGDKALEMFRYQLAKKTYSNLFDFHAPFQIDGNFGSAAGVMELLMQSQTDTIYILPALPTEWDKGEISGIKAKNGAEISISWEDNKASSFTVVPATDGDITIACDRPAESYKLNNEVISFTDGKVYTIHNAEAGKEYTFTASNETPAPPTETPSDKPVEITLTTDSVSVNTDNGVLITAGYNEDGVLTKVEIHSTYSAELSGYDDCAYIKAFCLTDLNDLKPLCDSKTALVK